MKLAIIAREKDPLSLIVYRTHLINQLSGQGVEIISTSENLPEPSGIDLIWDPGLSGNRVPDPVIKRYQAPFIATVHGAATIAMKLSETYRNPFSVLRGVYRNWLTQRAWRWLKLMSAAVITVSQFAAKEISAAYGISADKIFPVYHGLDHGTFHPINHQAPHPHAYLLVVAQYQPVKNVDRILRAYASLPGKIRLDLVLILPGFRGRNPKIDRVTVIRRSISPQELAGWYSGATAFLLPSLHETFGMPIVEAMACGCPVITSNGTACPEVAGDAALYVDPRSVDDIANAMRQISKDEGLRQALQRKGLARASLFSWEKCAAEHMEVFQKVLACAS